MFCLDHHVSTQICHSRDVFKRVFAHYKTGVWITKTCLCVTFNISHRVSHLTSHWCTWNDVKPHDFNLRTLLSMQLLKYETTFENISLTDAKTMCSSACSHIKKKYVYTLFDLRRHVGPICVTFNTWQPICHVISHWCSWNDIQPHDFLTYESFSACNFWHMKLCSNTLFHWRKGLWNVFTVRTDVPLHNFLTYGDVSEYSLTLTTTSNGAKELWACSL